MSHCMEGGPISQDSRDVFKMRSGYKIVGSQPKNHFITNAPPSTSHHLGNDTPFHWFSGMEFTIAPNPFCVVSSCIAGCSVIEQLGQCLSRPPRHNALWITFVSPDHQISIMDYRPSPSISRQAVSSATLLIAE